MTGAIRFRALVLSGFAIGICNVQVAAAAEDEKPSPIVQKVLDCRSIAGDAARLACYDSSVREMGQATASGDLTVVDRDQVRKAQRGLFGFSLPSLAFLHGGRGHHDEQDDDVQEITAKVRSAQRNGDGGWVVSLDDGSRWEQTNAQTLGRWPHAGSTVTIKRAALGSFKMTIDKNPPVKARRLQ